MEEKSCRKRTNSRSAVNSVDLGSRKKKAEPNSHIKLTIDEYVFKLSNFECCDKNKDEDVCCNCFTSNMITDNGELDYPKLKESVRHQHADLINKTLEEIQQLRFNAVAGAIVKRIGLANGTLRTEFHWSIIFGNSKLEVCR